MSQSKRGKRIALLAGCGVVVVIGVAAWMGRDHIRFWWLFESMGENDQGYPEYRHRQTGIVFVSLPGGTFNMGTTEKEMGKFLLSAPERDRKKLTAVSAWEKPIHEVNLSPFLIAKFEVSQAEWLRAIGDNPSKLKIDVLPVVQVSWEDCQRFCEKTGLKLPSEAQWEYACRAGTDGPFAGTGKLDEMGWYVKNSGSKNHPIGQKTPNDFGLYGMHGNVWEWCADVFDGDFYSKSEASMQDPMCTAGSDGRVMRGGSCWYNAVFCRSANRAWYLPSRRFDDLGFRPVWSPP